MPGRGIRVTGRVHGVGFRPHVWRLATRLGLAGTVLNDGAGVWIEIWGKVATLDAFCRDLRADPPPLARIGAVTAHALHGPAPGGFAIVESRQGDTGAEIAPDAATCQNCLAEIDDPANRRYRHAFAACADCGPRYSIAEVVPYDRAGTTLRRFDMCANCRAEYDDPANRRFHAQPIACPDCGPRLWLEDRNGPIDAADPIHAAVEALGAGRIVAIKGLGGFHLACDATAGDIVALLRHRKHRPDKPLALLVADLPAARALCPLTPAEEAVLAGPAAPILVAAVRAPLPGVAPGLADHGIMLPATPLHHLLARAAGRPLVLTSGNLSGAPPATDNAAARHDLAGIADLWLMHDRDIAARADDSVLRTGACGPTVLRRARGMAPDPIRLPEAFAKAPPVLAMGGDLKSAFCLLDRGRVVLPPQIGDLDDARMRQDYTRTLESFRTLFALEPARIAIDAHPDYASALIGRRLARETGAELVTIQHHHAHFAACLAENGVEPGETHVGLVLDGTGFGSDGTIWGGEVLVGGYAEIRRAGHLPAIALPGGAQAVREPWRNTLAHLVAAFGPDWRAQLAGTPLADWSRTGPVATVERMIARGLNAPPASSAGRLFDAVAFALGLCARQSHEGQAAMRLEALAAPHADGAGPYPVEMAADAGMIVPDLAPFWAAFLADLRRGTGPGPIAARVHRSLAGLFAQLAIGAAEAANTRHVALSGGVMQNRLLAETLDGLLRTGGLNVLRHRQVPPGDGGLALGQAAAAAAKDIG